MAGQTGDLPITSGSSPENELEILPPETQPGSPAALGTGTSTEPDYGQMGAGEVAYRALMSAPKSFAGQVGNLVTAIIHPVETAQAIGRAAYGAGSKLGILGGQSPEEKAKNEAELNAILQDYSNRYGSMAGFKKALATDPFSYGMDIAAFAPVVGTGAKAAGLSGVARAAQAARFLDPTQVALSTAAKAAGAVPGVAAKAVGMESGITPSIMRYAAQAGMTTDPVIRNAYQRFSAGAGDLSEISNSARNALDEILDAGNKKYINDLNNLGMAPMASQPLSFSRIDTALNEATKTLAPHGQFASPAAQQTFNDLNAYINGGTNSANQTLPGWRNLEPTTSHTIIGMNDLKKGIGNMIHGPNAGDLDIYQKQALNNVYAAVRKTIQDQSDAIMRAAPAGSNLVDYAKIMENWQDHLNTVNNWTKTMGLSNRTAEASRIGKLLSSPKKDQTRSILDQMAATNAGKALPYMIAGAATSAFPDVPHLIFSGMLGAGAYNLLAHPFAVPAAGAIAALSSPKVAGSLAYGAGAAARPLQYIRGALPSVSPDVIQQAREIARGTSPVSGIVRQTPVRAAGAMDVVGQQTQQGRYAPERMGDIIDFDPSELAPRPQRASGGKVDDHERLVGRLMDLAEKAKKQTQNSTKPLLEAPDEAIVHALKVADSVI